MSWCAACHTPGTFVVCSLDTRLLDVVSEVVVQAAGCACLRAPVLA